MTDRPDQPKPLQPAPLTHHAELASRMYPSAPDVQARKARTSAAQIGMLAYAKLPPRK